MRPHIFLPLLAFTVLTGCAEHMHQGRSALVVAEQKLLVASHPASGSGFKKFWRAGKGPVCGYVKWDEDHSWSVPEAPRELLQTIRDQVGLLNQGAGSQDPVFLTVTVFSYRGAAQLELVGRSSNGKAVWIAEDDIEPSPSLAEALSDSESLVIGREVRRKLRLALRE